MKSKTINGKPGFKAHLCARGFEEEQNFRTGSLTCSTEGLRITLLTASNKWKINYTDVKATFLQGNDLEREREVFVKPPKEAQTDKLML